jgi:hypothetical protein
MARILKKKCQFTSLFYEIRLNVVMILHVSRNFTGITIVTVNFFINSTYSRQNTTFLCSIRLKYKYVIIIQLLILLEIVTQ